MARWRLRMEDFGRRQEGGNRTSEAWHQPRWASKALISKGEEERPMSSGSTRCPSSARCSRGRQSPQSPAPSVETRAPSPNSPACWAQPAPPSLRASSDTWATRVDPKQRGQEKDYPATYSIKPGDLGGSLLPDYPLWVTLHGGNGRWQQARAQNQWAQMLVEHEAAMAAKKLETERQRLRRAEVARIRRAEEEELRRRVEEAEQDKRRRKEEELRLQMQREEEARRAKLEEERLLELMQPRKCQRCEGSGRCANCQGEGSVDVLFLAPSVGSRPMPILQGRRPRGCRQCGGAGDGALLRDFVAGSGRCDVCKGERFIKPPPGGFKTPAKAEAPLPTSRRTSRDNEALHGSTPDATALPE
ncbi:unnamed protein product [Symbiodinium natans]|uniref:Uncharacterized protein n=1 Tax=Symbiodinium natans TaxID=878477 RepID=A0A812HTW9_9DINO|nr:unnamed protein product [Symbiodinium natans]